MIYKNLVKSCFDYGFIILISPFWLIAFCLLSLLIFLFDGTPILFKQERVGKDEQIFCLMKFRTMKNVNSDESKITDEARLTKLGILLRKLSLDEIPQFFNIIKGEMSLIGPRPLFVKYLPFYKPQEKKRHSVKPGITGLAQVNGRNLLSWEDRFHLDVEYVRNCSVKMDLFIIGMTLIKVIKKESISLNSIPDLSDYREINDKQS